MIQMVTPVLLPMHLAVALNLHLDDQSLKEVEAPI